MINKLLILLTFVIFFLIPNIIYAETFQIKQPGGVPVEFNDTKPAAETIVETVLVNVISIFFTVGGLGVVIYFIWGAVDWILSGGDKEKVASARKKMTNAIVGLVLLSLSYVIINIVGQVVGFNPLGGLQLPGLGFTGQRAVNQ